jgi:dipeptidyl aminopeptidase/acylaminoacyl peptidase
MSTSQRYSRAARLTAPKVAAQTPGLAVEGYWLDENLYYFLAKCMEPSVGCMVSVPSVADCKAQTVAEVIPLQQLAELLSVDFQALSSARFDMPARNTLAVSIKGRDYLINAQQQRIVEASPSFEVPALYSPDGHWACYMRGDNLWLRARDTGVERALTADGGRDRRYGHRSAFGSPAAQVPVGLWSPDSQWFLTHRIDEEDVPESALLQHAPPGAGRPILHQFKYPMPGDPLPIAAYCAFHPASGRIVTFDEFPVPVLSWSPFFWRMAWFDGRDTAWCLRVDRYFKQAELIRLDLAQGTGRIVLRECVESGHIDLHPIVTVTPNVRTLVRSSEIIWYSERDGWGHLYLHDTTTGALKNRITCGEWLVRDIVHVDELRRTVLFTACGVDPRADPARRSLCSVNLDGGGFEVLCVHDGDTFVPRTEPCGLTQERPFCPSYAQAGVSPGSHFAVVRYASVERGNRTEIVDLSNRRGFVIASAQPAANEISPQHFTALAADGVTTLHGVLFFPSDFNEQQRYPLIDYIYPGPQNTQAPQSFRSTNSAPARSLAELGCITVMLDTRGMPFRSSALHQIGYGQLLEPQLADHAAVARQLCERYSFIDGERVGMLGQSGGGAATARALFDYGDLFKVGVSVCGNHDSTYMSAFWSDKYRGPESRERWAREANGAAAHKLKGKLLLVSGDMDEVVHVSQTLGLADALIGANRDFDLLIVPNEGHFVLLTSAYTQRRIWDYFVRHLLHETPPENFEMHFTPEEIASVSRMAWREVRQ